MADKRFVVHGHWRRVKMADGSYKQLYIATHMREVYAKREAKAADLPESPSEERFAHGDA